MKKRNLIYLLPFLTLLVGCGNNGNQGGKEPEPPVVVTPTIAIEGEEAVYITKSLTLTAQISNSTSAVDWSVDKTDLASINGGVLTALKAGTVKVTAKLHDNEEVKAEKTIVVKDTLIDVSVNAEEWGNFEGVYSDEPVMRTTAPENLDDIKTLAKFKNLTGKYYYASADFEIKGHKPDGWVWNQIGILNMTSDNETYGMGFSGNKIITQFIQTDDPTQEILQKWTAESDRSQVWNQHGISELANASKVNLKTIRNDGDFYYFINDELYWKEGAGFNAYDDKNTTPVIFSLGYDVEVSNIVATYNYDFITAELAKPAALKKLYASFANDVEIGDNSVKFKNVDTATSNSKDVAAKSIGDAMLLPAQKESTVTFDVVIDQWGSNDAVPVVCMDMRRYDSNPQECRSFMIGKDAVSFAGWNYDGTIPGGYPAGDTKYNNGTGNVRLAEGTSYHVVCTRLMTAGGQDTKIDLYQGEQLLATKTHNWQDGYSGNAVVYFSVRNVAATITNIAIAVSE